MRKFLFNTIGIVFLVSLLFAVKRLDISTGVDVLVNVLAALLLFFLNIISSNLDNIWLYCVTHTYLYNKPIRLSISYLYKIKINDRYLLVKGKRIPNQYQPVGGVYKRFRESYYQLGSLGVTDDDNIPIDDKSIDDLRIKLPGRNLLTFIKWFNSQLGREVSPGREFYEELISTNILSRSSFPYPNYLYVKRHQTPIHYSEHFKCYEILIADLFELQPNEHQKEQLQKTMAENNEEFVWVSEDRIKRLGAIPNGTSSFTIAPTATWLL